VHTKQTAAVIAQTEQANTPQTLDNLKQLKGAKD
jgi:hypothetical protein